MNNTPVAKKDTSGRGMIEIDGQPFTVDFLQQFFVKSILGEFDYSRLGPGIHKALQKAVVDTFAQSTASLNSKIKRDVILRVKRYGSDHVDKHETIKDAAITACAESENGDSFPHSITEKGVIIWHCKNDSYTKLYKLAGAD